MSPGLTSGFFRDVYKPFSLIVSPSTCRVERLTERHRSSMKAIGSRLSFCAGFAVGTLTLYVFLRQVWLEKTSTQQADQFLDNQLQLNDEDKKVWKKERSALFNLKHPHHKGTPHGRFMCTIMQRHFFFYSQTILTHFIRFELPCSQPV